MHPIGRWSPFLGILDRERARLAGRLADFAHDRALLVDALRAEFVDKPASWLHRALEARAESVADALEDGSSLDEALAQRPRDFRPWEIALGRLAEQQGAPGRVLGAWKRRLLQSADVKDAASNSFVYPLMLVWTCLVVWALLLWKVVPTMAALYTSLGTALPLPTRLLIMTSNVLASLVYPLFVLAALLVAVSIVLRLASRGSKLGARLVDRLPLVGRHQRQADRALAIELLAAQAECGIEPARALAEVAEALPSELSREEVAAEARRWAEGAPPGDGPPGRLLDAGLRRALQRALAAPDHAALNRLAAAEAARTDRLVESGLAAFEPMSILFGGLLLGWSAIALLMPMFELSGLVAP